MLGGLLLLSGCTREDDQSSAERVARAFVTIVSRASGERDELKRAYGLLSPNAKENLARRTDLAMRTFGIRLEPVDLLTPDSAALPRELIEVRVSPDGDNAALVSVRGEGKETRLPCVRVAGKWWVDPPTLSAPMPASSP